MCVCVRMRVDNSNYDEYHTREIDGVVVISAAATNFLQIVVVFVEFYLVFLLCVGTISNFHVVTCDPFKSFID